MRTLLDCFTGLKKLKEFLGDRVWWLVVFSTLTGLFVFFIEMSFVVVLQLFLFSIGLLSNDKLLIPNWLPTSQNFVIGLLFVFGLSRGLIYMLKFYLTGMAGQEFAKTQRTRVVEYGLSFASDVSTNQIITIFTERVSQGGVFLQTISQLLLVLTSATLFFLTGLKIAHWEMIIGICTMAIFLFPLKFFNKNIASAGEGLRGEWNFVSANLISGLKNNFFLRVYNLVESEIRKSVHSLDMYLIHYRRYYRISAFKSFLPNILGIFVVCLIALISLKYIHTKPVLLVGFFYIFIRFSQNMSEVNSSFSDLALYRASFLELYDLHLLHKKYIHKMNDGINNLQTSYSHDAMKTISININNISFSYDKGPTLFKDIAVKVNIGEVLLIKGPSGVGKSTLLMLILGMIKPNKGEVTINDINIQEFDHTISKYIGYVGPEPFLVIGTIKENLLFGHIYPESIAEKDLQDALEWVCLDPSAFPLNLQIMEHASLSTGQKQRISIARAILRKPKLLILDEATANLDKDTEIQILHNLKPLISKITTIVISHKPSFDSMATVILNLEKNPKNID